MDEATVFLVAAFGSSLQELSYWYDARARLALKKYQAMLRSSTYWIITMLMIVGSGAATLIWINLDPSMYELRDYLLFGAAFPLIFKKAVGTAAKAKAQVKLGSADRAQDAQDHDQFSTADAVQMW